MSEIAKLRSHYFGKILLLSISLFNIYLYTCLSFILMRVFGFPYEPYSDLDLAMAGLIMSGPLFIPFASILWRLNIEQMEPKKSRIAMLKFFAVTIPVLAVYCFCFMYLNINFAPGGEQLCAGKIVEKRRVRVKSGISHRLVVECEIGQSEQFHVEKRVSQANFEEFSKGDLIPLTYLRGRLGVNLVVKRE